MARPMNPPALPQPAVPAEYYAVHPEAEPWLEAARWICHRHDLTAASLERRLEGGNIVFMTEAAVIKLFAPLWRNEAAVERAALEHLGDRLPAPVPSIRASGELDGWPYLVLERLRGRPIGEVRKDLVGADREALAAELGAFARALHAMPLGDLSRFAIDTTEFMAAQRAGCEPRHREKGASDALVSGIGALLDRAELDGASAPRVIVHADLADVNVLVVERRGRWTLSGVIDFGDAFVGHGAYELATPFEFLLAGRPGPLRAFLRAYGFAPDELDDRLGDRIFAYALLHRFANLRRFADFVGSAQGGATFDSLEELRRAAWL